MSKRVMMLSHGLTAVTGFGNQHWLTARALTDAGYEVFSCHKDYRGEAIKFGPGSVTENGKDLSGITLLPWGQSQWLEDKMPFYIEHYRPDYIFTLGDIWCYQYFKELPTRHKFTWIAQYEFDTENIVGFWHENVAAPDIAVVPAKFAYEMLRNAGHKNVVYLPHAVNTELYKPATADEKAEIRKKIGFSPNDFVISCVAHNQQRKMLARLIRAFKLFSEDKPNAKLFMHTQVKDFSGWDLPQIIGDWGLTEKVMLTDKSAKMIGDVHVSPKMLREYYCMSDVHAISSGGEGFGVPMVEAMACGLPNVAPAYTTPKEFLCDFKKGPKDELVMENVRGIAVPYIDIEYHHTGGVWALVDIEKMANAFQTLYDDPTLRHKYGTKARAFAIENYDEKPIKDSWVRLFNEAPEFVRALEEERANREDTIHAVKISGRQG